MNSGNTKRHLKKEYIPLLIALLVLVVLVLMLIIVIFYKDNKGLEVPDLPEAEALNINIMDIKSGKYDGTEVNEDDAKRVKIDYEVISDYYTNGILLSSPVIEYSDGEFILRSGDASLDPYVSIISKKGKLMWLNKINFKGYNSFKIKKVFKKDKSYFAFAEATNDSGNDIVAIMFNEKGNEETREVVLKNTKNTLSKVEKSENGFIVATQGEENIKIICLSDKLLLLNNIYSLEEDKNNMFFSSKPQIFAMSYKDNKLYLTLKYKGRLDNYMYLMNYNISNRTSSIKEFTELSKLEKDFSGSITGDETGFYVELDNSIYHFDVEGKLLKNYDYNKVKLDPSEVEIVSDEVDEEGNTKSEKVANTITLFELRSYEGNYLTYSSTLTDIVYDIFDANLNIQKRIVMDVNVYDRFGENAIPLKEFYIDDYLYVISLFGDKTKSIMIAKIG